MNQSLDRTTSPSRSERARLPAGMWAVLALALVIIVWYLLTPQESYRSRLIGDLAFTLTSALAAILCFRTAARLGDVGTPWRLLGQGCAAWFAGQLVWNYYDLVLNIQVPYPSLADVGYLLFYPFCFAGLFRLVHATSPTLSVEAVLDALIVSAVAALLVYELLLLPIETNAVTGPFSLGVSLIWQVGTVSLLLLGTLALIWNADPAVRRQLILLQAGLFSFAIVDVIYGLIALSGGYAVGATLDLGWHFGFLFVAAAALIAADPPADTPVPRRPADIVGLRSLGTLISILAFGGLSAYAAWTPASNLVLAGGIVVVAVLLAVKLAYAARQERRLANRTRERDRLAAEVAAREATQAEMAAALAAQRAANAELARLNQTKSDFVTIVSHEFRTPLTSVQGFADILREEDVQQSEIRDFAGIISDNARRLARMIDEMLDLDRLQSAQAEQPHLPVDLNDVISRVAATLRASSDCHTIRLELEPGLPPVSGDRDRLAQVVTNLLANAIKYDPTPGELLLTTAREGGDVHLSVRDSGIGIPPEALESIFERFVRVANPDHHIPGTGLGLPITRQIVERHGGRVWAESTPGEGSTFHVVLPLPDPLG